MRVDDDPARRDESRKEDIGRKAAGPKQIERRGESCRGDRVSGWEGPIGGMGALPSKSEEIVRKQQRRASTTEDRLYDVGQETGQGDGGEDEGRAPGTEPIPFGMREKSSTPICF